MSMNKLLLVDGGNLLFQMFYGMSARIKNSAGKAIQGTMGFVGALVKIIKIVKPSQVVVLFDGEHYNERSDIDNDYKANRIDYSTVAEEENLFSQLEGIYAALEYLKIKHTETTTCETDDWIVAYAYKYGNDRKIIISSFDSDFFQLLTDNILVLRYRGVNSKIYTPQDLYNRFGIKPAQYADFKALVGDALDNIAGAEKVGVKTAAKLLKKFETLENLLANAEQIENAAIKASIMRNAKKLQSNYKLIKLTSNAQLLFELNELEYNYGGSTTTEIIKAIQLLP